MKSDLYSLTGKWQAVHKDIFLVYCTSISNLNQFALDFHRTKTSKHMNKHCQGPSEHIVNVTLLTLREIGITSTSNNETVVCAWEFRSKPPYKVEIIIDSVENMGFTGVSDGCEYGGILLIDGKGSSGVKNQTTFFTRFGPFCRGKFYIDDIYKSLLGITNFVSSTEYLHVRLFNVGGMGRFTMKAWVRATSCFGLSFIPDSYSPSSQMAINEKRTFSSKVRKCTQIQLVMRPTGLETKTISIEYPILLFRPLLHASASLLNTKPSCNLLVLKNEMLRYPLGKVILQYFKVCPIIEGFYLYRLSIGGETCNIFPPNGSFLKPSKCGLLRLTSRTLHFIAFLSTTSIPYDVYIDQLDLKYYSLKIWRQGKNEIDNCELFTIIIDEINMGNPYVSRGPSSISYRTRSYSACDITQQGIHLKTINGKQIKIKYQSKSYAKTIYLSYQMNTYKFPTQQNCPDGFYLQNKKCYYYKSGYLNKRGQSWNDARAFCKTMNATLLSITSLKEMDVIKYLMTSAWSSHIYLYPASTIHIGLHDDNEQVREKRFKIP